MGVLKGSIWAFLGLPGLRELVLVALVALVLYGRAGLRRTRFLRTYRSRLSMARRRVRPPAPSPAPSISKRGDRVFWFLAITAAAAVAAWIATRMVIVAGPGPSH